MMRDKLRKEFPGISAMLVGIKSAFVAVQAYTRAVEAMETLEVSEKQREKEMMEAKLYITVEEV